MHLDDKCKCISIEMTQHSATAHAYASRLLPPSCLFCSWLKLCIQNLSLLKSGQCLNIGRSQTLKDMLQQSGKRSISIPPSFQTHQMFMRHTPLSLENEGSRHTDLMSP